MLDGEMCTWVVSDATWGLICAAFLGSTMRTCSKCLRVCCLSFCSARTYFFSRLKTWRGYKRRTERRRRLVESRGRTGGYIHIQCGPENKTFVLASKFQPEAKMCKIHKVPWVGPAAARSGSSPEPGGGGRWAEPPRGPCGSPPAAAAHWPPPAPAPPPSPGNAETHTHELQLTDEWKDTKNIGWLCICPERACRTWMTAFLSARGRFLASLSASSHFLITWVQEKVGNTLIILVNL